MSIGIDELFDMLSWNSDEETQRKGIELARNIKCISVFLQPYGSEHSKDVWENCAKIVAAYPDEAFQYCLHESLEWLADMNWPGSEIILQRLIEFKDSKFLSLVIEHCVKEALVCDDQIWLGNMAALLKNEDLKTFLPKDIFNTLYCRWQHSS